MRTLFNYFQSTFSVNFISFINNYVLKRIKFMIKYSVIKNAHNSLKYKEFLVHQE